MRLWSTHWTNTHTHIEHCGLNKWRKVRKSSFLQWPKPHKSSCVHIQAWNNPQHQERPHLCHKSLVSQKIPQSFGTNMKSCLLLPPRHTRPPLFKPLWSRCLQHPYRSQGNTYTETPSGSVLQLCMWMYVCVWRPCNTWAQIYNFWIYFYLHDFYVKIHCCISRARVCMCTCVFFV